MESKLNSPCNKRQGKDTQKSKENEAQRLFNTLFEKPKSRRMGATAIGYKDQTYMVTQLIYDWLKSGKAQVVGKMKCLRSGRFVEFITTNPEYFKEENFKQLTLF